MLMLVKVGVFWVGDLQKIETAFILSFWGGAEGVGGSLYRWTTYFTQRMLFGWNNGKEK